MAGLEGRTLDRYELHRSVGKGGMADVYLAFDPRFEREVAIKVFKREDEDLLRRFIREARLMASLRNAHLMPVLDTGESMLDGSPQYYIVMPYMGGGTLRGRIRKSPLSLKEVCTYLTDIADALDYMHSLGIIHRDIKASNVLLDTDSHCYISDFGIARTNNEATQMTSTGNVLGTVDYIAPELFEPNRKADARSDLYSLSVLTYEMVTAHLPFTAENQIAVVTMHVTKAPPSPREYVPSLPGSVEQVMLRALAKKPEQRYETCGDFAAAFCYAVQHPKKAVVTDYATTLQNSQPVPAIAPQGLILPTPAPAPVTQHFYPTPQQTSGFYNQQPQYQPQQPQYSGKPPKNRSRAEGRLVALIALVTLLAILIPTAYVFYTQPWNHPGATNTPTTIVGSPSNTGPTPTPTPDTNATNTSLAQQNTTATAEQNQKETSTAVAVGSATAGAVASATAAFTGTLVYQDPLLNASGQGGWQQVATKCQFSSDGYHVANPLPHAYTACLAEDQTYDNFRVKVDLKIQKGTYGGIFVRAVPNGDGTFSGVLFQIKDGGFSVTTSDAYPSGSTTDLQGLTTSPAIKAGKNTLQVLARDNSLTFYINGTVVATLNAPGIAASGKLGLAAFSDAASPAEVVYTNLEVYKLS